MSPVDLPLAILAIAFAIALVRIAAGPSLGDRIIATELTFVVLLAGLGLLTARIDDEHIMDVAVIAALLQFITTAALAYLFQAHRTSEEESE